LVGFFGRPFLDPCPEIATSDTVVVVDTVVIHGEPPPPEYIIVEAEPEITILENESLYTTRLDTSFNDGAELQVTHVLTIPYAGDPYARWDLLYQAPEPVINYVYETKTVTNTLSLKWYQRPEYVIPAAFLSGVVLWEAVR
jgi:hypothetical protein